MGISMCWVAVTLFSLATPCVFIYLSYRIFLPAYLPAFHFFHSVRNVFSDIVLFGPSSKFSFRLGALKHISASVSECSPGVLQDPARTSVFFVFG